MKIAISAAGTDLEAATSPIFGRCPAYVFVDTQTMEYQGVPNPAVDAPGGAGIQAAQFIVEQGAQAVVSGNVGPNAMGVFRAASIPVYLFEGGTVRQAAEALAAGKLQAVEGANVPAHSGMGGGRGTGLGRGGGRGAR